MSFRGVGNPPPETLSLSKGFHVRWKQQQELLLEISDRNVLPLRELITGREMQICLVMDAASEGFMPGMSWAAAQHLHWAEVCVCVQCSWLPKLWSCYTASLQLFLCFSCFSTTFHSQHQISFLFFFLFFARPSACRVIVLFVVWYCGFNIALSLKWGPRCSCILWAAVLPAERTSDPLLVSSENILSIQSLFFISAHMHLYFFHSSVC